MMLTTNDQKPTKREQDEAKMRQAVKLLKQMNVVLPVDFNFAGPHALGVLQGAIQSSNAATDKMKQEADKAARANEIAEESLKGYPRRSRYEDEGEADEQPEPKRNRRPTMMEDMPMPFSERTGAVSIRCKCGGSDLSHCTCHGISKGKANEIANATVKSGGYRLPAKRNGDQAAVVFGTDRVNHLANQSIRGQALR